MAKKALLIGINRYQVAGADLRGCVNDATNMRSMLVESFDFPKSGITMLTDANATKKNMEKEIRSLLRGARAGDVLLLHYSGHGANVPDDDESRDESDGVDEILCPTDLNWYEPLRDDWLRREFNQLADGVNFTVIMDCCHSGSNTRELRNPTSREPLARYLPSPWALALAESGYKELAPTRTLGRPRPRRGRQSRDNVSTPKEIKETLVTGCRDDQTSADAWINGSFQGAMTANLLRALRDGGAKKSYRQVHQELLKYLRRDRFPQRPQLEGKAANLDRPFLAPF